MVAHSLDYGYRARVPYGETLARPAVYEHFAARSPVQQCVSGYGVILGRECAVQRRVNHYASSAKAFASIVVGLAFQAETYAFCKECSETLARRPFERYLYGAFGQSGLAVTPGHFAREHCAYGAVGVGNGIFERHFLLVEQGFFSSLYD